jgi:hypothetical protein
MIQCVFFLLLERQYSPNRRRPLSPEVTSGRQTGINDPIFTAFAWPSFDLISCWF